MRLPDIIYKIYSKINKSEQIKPTKYPTDIDWSLTNLCNLNCEMCPNDKIKKKKGYATDELFKLIVDCVQNKFDSKPMLGLGAWGEPLLHPKFIELLNHATEKGIKTKMASNCVNLNKDISEAITDSTMVLFEISLYSLKKDRHNKMVGKDVFDKVFNNIHTFLSIASKKGYKGMIRLRPLENYADEAVEYEKEFYNRYPNLNFQRQEPKQLGNWAGFFKISGKSMKNYVRIPCTFCFSRMAVDYDGEVKVCCQAMLSEDLIVGQIDKNCDLSDIWNGEKLKSVRKKFLNLDYTDFPSCQKCLNARKYLKFSDILKLIKK